MEQKGRVFIAPIICTMCKEALNTLHDIKLHRRRHETISLLCTHCAETFKTATDMAYHLNKKGAQKREISEEGAKLWKAMVPTNAAELSFLTEESFKELMRDVEELINDDNGAAVVDCVVGETEIRDDNGAVAVDCAEGGVAVITSGVDVSPETSSSRRWR